jgi:outer membrane receptor protein involved in Fe transport
VTAAALLTPFLGTAASSMAHAQEQAHAWRWTMQAGTVHQSDAALDSGGGMSVERWFASAGPSRAFDGGWVAGVTVGYGEDRYDFSGVAGLGGLDPWGRIRELRVSVPIRYVANRHWTLFAIPSLRFNAESGASLGDGQTGGLLTGVSYRVSDSLSIGPGLGAFTEIEDDASLFPILLIDWAITDTLSLETGGGFAASRGPGVQLKWQYSPRWQFAVGGRYEKTRFRLDDWGAAPAGVGEDKAFPLFASARFTLDRDIQLSLIAGAELNASLRLEDASGNLIERTDMADAAFFGASLKARF